MVITKRIAGSALFPLLVSLIGIVLISAAWPLPELVPDYTAPLVQLFNSLLWFGLLIAGTAITAKASQSYGRAVYAFIVLVLFLLSVSPLGILSIPGHPPLLSFQHYRIFCSQAFALAGFVLLFMGLGGTRPLYPFLQKLAYSAYGLMLWRRRNFLAAAFIMFTGGLIFLSWYCYALVPVYDDSIAQYIHAKWFADGHLYGHSQKLHSFFTTTMMVTEGGKWYSQYQPMHIFMLAIGQLLGVPFIINPISAGITLLLIYRAAQLSFGEAIARISVCFTLMASFLWFMSAEFMNHVTALLFTMALCCCYLEFLNRRLSGLSAYRWCVGAGLCLGALMLTRPVTALGISLPFILHALYLFACNPRLYWRSVLCMVGGLAVCVAFQLFYDWQLTGHAFLPPYLRYNPNNMPGFTHIYHWTDMWTKAQDEWRSLNVAMFEWPIPSFFLLACVFIRPLGSTGARLLVAMLASLTLADMYNHYNSGVFGPRYLYELSGALIILSAAGLVRFTQLWRRAGDDVAIGSAIVAVALLFACSSIYRQPANLERYSHYFHGARHYQSVMRSKVQLPALIFIDPENVDFDRFETVAYLNPQPNNADIIYAHDLGSRNYNLIKYYPGRHYYYASKHKLTELALPADH